MQKFIGQDGLIRNSDGTFAMTLVSGNITVEVSYPELSVILLRLYEETDFGQGRTSATSDQIRDEDVHQFYMTADLARIVAARLLARADEIDGIDQPRQ